MKGEGASSLFALSGTVLKSTTTKRYDFLFLLKMLKSGPNTQYGRHKSALKIEIGRRPDRRTEVSELAPIDIVNNLATGEKAPERRFSVLFFGNITQRWVLREEGGSAMLFSLS